MTIDLTLLPVTMKRTLTMNLQTMKLKYLNPVSTFWFATIMIILIHDKVPHDTDLLDFRPFVKTGRGKEWALSKEGKNWIIDRICQYEQIKGPLGVDGFENKRRLKKHQKAWIIQLAADYIANWPDFEWREVIGKRSSQKALRKAKKVSDVDTETMRKRLNYVSLTRDQRHSSATIFQISANVVQKMRMSYFECSSRKPGNPPLWTSGVVPQKALVSASNMQWKSSPNGINILPLNKQYLSAVALKKNCLTNYRRKNGNSGRKKRKKP
jgi:hypothetical protein